MRLCVVAALCTLALCTPTPEQWLRDSMQANLEQLVASLDHPMWTNISATSRDYPNGALAALLLNTSSLPLEACPGPAAVDLAARLLRVDSSYGTSFNAQAVPPLLNTFLKCFNASTQAWFLGAVNASLPATVSGATTADVSYTNMWFMSTVNALLMGEFLEATPAGAVAAGVGLEMLEEWGNYTAGAGVHEFTSPTYTDVQVGALYMGYIHAKSGTARGIISKALEYIWMDTCANWFPPQSALSGAHSRDYDGLLGHGMFDIDIFAQGLPFAAPLVCEYRDPHCEGPRDTVANGTGEPMLATALTLYNLLHPGGFRVSPATMAVCETEEREVRSHFLGQAVTANGNEARFASLYNYVTPSFAIGSASQDYVTNTHTPYYPYPGDKLVNILLGPSKSPGVGPAAAHGRPNPAVTIVPDTFDSPYGVWRQYPVGEPNKATHWAPHPGNVQDRGLLLATLALNTQDALDSFTPSGNGPAFTSLATNVILPLLANDVLLQPNASSPPVGFTPPPGPFSKPLPLTGTVGVRVADASLAFKAFVVDGAGGMQPSLALKGDALGMGLGAMRVVATHFADSVPRNLSETGVRVAFVFQVAATQDLASVVAAVAALETRSEEGRLPDGSTAWVASVPGRLSVSRNMTCTAGGSHKQTVHTSFNCLVDRGVNGSSVTVGPLSVNGVLLDPFVV